MSSAAAYMCYFTAVILVKINRKTGVTTDRELLQWIQMIDYEYLFFFTRENEFHQTGLDATNMAGSSHLQI